MSRRKKKVKKGLHPGFAALILLGSVAFVAMRLFDPNGEKSGLGIAGLLGDGDDQPVMPESSQTPEVVWIDLLALHGSFDGESTVRMAFESVPEAQYVPAAPGGETATNAAEGWEGEDPPLLRLGVVMVSSQSRRAVLGGTVVGVGDTISGGEVLSIEPGRLRLRWQRRQLTYDLDTEVPREFRTELNRRALEQLEGSQSASVEAGGDQPGKEQGKEEK